MKIRLLLTAFLLFFCCFKKYETSIKIVVKGNITYLTIYPIKNDTTFIIKREFARNKYCREEIFKNGKRLILTTFNYYQNQLSYDEYIFSDDGNYENTFQIQENYNTDYSPLKKSFPLEDSTSFKVYYYPNGNLKSCAIETSFCKRYNGYEFNLDNSEYSLGKFSTKVTYDTTKKVIDGLELTSIGTDCGKHMGIWRTYDFNNELLKSEDFGR